MKIELPKLYAKDKSGRIKIWKVSVESLLNGASTYTITHGLEDGKKQVTVREITEGKNIGKANETTTYEQATSEATSHWNKKVDSGYCQSVDEIPNASTVKFFLPMLAHKFDERGNQIKYPAYVQPKLDGFRCLSEKAADGVQMWSRKGKEFSVPDKIIAELNDLFEEGYCMDGELYHHDWRVDGETDFQRISSAAKKHRPDTDLLQYHIYDFPAEGLTFEERFVNASFESTERIKKVETYLVNSEEEMLEYFDKFRADHYEGLMIRNREGFYLFGGHRSTDLQKVKDFEDAEYEITGGKEATGKDKGTVVFQCVTETGKVFDVRPCGTRELRAEYWQDLDKYIGQKLTVRYNGKTNDGVPRFCRGMSIRPDWDI